MVELLMQVTALEYLKQMRQLPPEEQLKHSKDIIAASQQVVKDTGSMIPVLGMLLHIRQRPFTEDMFPQFEPLFSTRVPPRSILKTARQVGKSSSFAAKTIIMSAMIPFFQTLTVTPQYEMTRRYSSNYIRPMIEFSPIKAAVIDTNCEKSVLQKTLSNQSMMHFSFAFLNADRVRGIPSDRIHFDEFQDIDCAFVPEIEQTMGRSKWRITDISGTPKTLDNGIEVEWSKSSMAEWFIPCECGYTNNPCIDSDGMSMIGDETLICAKCKHPVDGTTGYWYHEHSDRRNEYVGYHVPQFILPFHYDNKRNWNRIVAAKHGSIPKRTFYNEVLGESCDIGAKLITETDLKKACTLPVNMTLKTSRKLIEGYMFRALGVDWGGRGEDTLSFTKLAVTGMRPDGRIDLLYGENLVYLPEPGEEVARVMAIHKAFGCHVLAHDTGGTAGMRDTFMSHAGFSMQGVMPFAYVAAWVKEIVTFHETTETVRRPYYSIDKTKSLLLLVECIKHGYINCPRWDSCKDLLVDVLALIEEKNESKRGSDIYLVRRSANQCDDFAHALNFAVVATFHSNGKWPDLVEAVQQRSLSEFELDQFVNAGLSLEEWEENYRKADVEDIIDIIQ